MISDNTSISVSNLYHNLGYTYYLFNTKLIKIINFLEKKKDSSEIITFNYNNLSNKYIILNITFNEAYYFFKKTKSIHSKNKRKYFEKYINNIYLQHSSLFNKIINIINIDNNDNDNNDKNNKNNKQTFCKIISEIKKETIQLHKIDVLIIYDSGKQEIINLNLSGIYKDLYINSNTYTKVFIPDNTPFLPPEFEGFKFTNHVAIMTYNTYLSMCKIP